MEIYNPFQEQVRKLFDDNSFMIYDGFYLAALGARICYSDKHPAALLLYDERVYAPDKRVEFLGRCARRGHYSVFAHSPVEIIEGRGVDPTNITKLWKCGPTWIANGWHLADAGLVESVMDTADENKVDMIFIDVHGMERDLETAAKENLDGILYGVIRMDDSSWDAVVIHGASRVCTHQIVRHVWLNISQRSLRYTKLDENEFYYPVIKHNNEMVVNSAYNLMQKSYQTAYMDYNLLTTIMDVPRDAARYVLPMGAKSTIMLSGPSFAIDFFCRRRNSNEAAPEIRQWARLIEHARRYYYERTKKHK